MKHMQQSSFFFLWRDNLCVADGSTLLVLPLQGLGMTTSQPLNVRNIDGCSLEKKDQEVDSTLILMERVLGTSPLYVRRAWDMQHCLRPTETDRSLWSAAIVPFVTTSCIQKCTCNPTLLRPDHLLVFLSNLSSTCVFLLFTLGVAAWSLFIVACVPVPTD